MTAPEDLLETLEALGPLLARLESLADPHVRAPAQAIVRGVLDFHRAAMQRCLEILGAAGPGAEQIVDALASDGLVGSMLVLHGLHPVPLEQRARRALQQGCPNGWRVDDVDVQDAEVRVRLSRTADQQRAADAEKVRRWAEDALGRAAPDADTIDLVGELTESSLSGIVPVARLRERRVGGIAR